MSAYIYILRVYLSLYYTLLVMRATSCFVYPHREPSPMPGVVARASRDFDFSSKAGWNQFYEDESEIVEWHSSVPLNQLIGSYIPVGCSCLMIGCGTSRLPRVIYDTHGAATQLTCFDSSSTCLEQLKQQFDQNVKGKDPPRIKYVCGDAVQLSAAFGDDGSFDLIVDKGLMDALLCGEGWNGPVERLMRESINQLKFGGQYLLVSYQLPPSTQAFLCNVSSPHLQWDFHRPEQNSRVQVSLATRVV